MEPPLHLRLKKGTVRWMDLMVGRYGIERCIWLPGLELLLELFTHPV
jgi:hypothetical protein